MTSSEKAVETRRRNKEARDQKDREKRQIKESMKKALQEVLQEVLESDQATVDQKLEASKILSELIA